MTTTSPLPPHAADPHAAGPYAADPLAAGPYAAPAGWAPVPVPAPTPAAVQQGLVPVRTSRVDPAAVWTVVVAVLVAVIALAVGLAVTSSDGSADGQDAVDSVFDGGGYGYVDYYDDSDCYDAFC